MFPKSATCVALSCCLLLIVSCSKSDWHEDPSKAAESSDGRKLKIEVIGSSSDPMWKGAEAANAAIIEKDKELNNLIVVETYDDSDDPEKAAEKAREIRKDQRVIAVVGHTRSGTTLAALPYYADAGIPVLMPAASSPYVFYSFDHSAIWPPVDKLHTSYPRFNNAFRLLPSDVSEQDVADQVRAIKLTTEFLAPLRREERRKREGVEGKDKRETGNVMVICDTTKRTGSDIYTRPMCETLRRDPIFATLLAAYRELELDAGDIYGLVTEIHAVKPDIIVLVGYPEFARDLLEEMKERAAQPGVQQPMSSYTFVISDTGKRNGLLDFGSAIYVTSPIKSGECHPDQGDAKIPAEQVYAYDAVSVLAKAVTSCDRGVDRACVLGKLRKNLAGACESYVMTGGEPTNAKYYVYGTCKKSPELKKPPELELKLRWTIELNTKKPKDLTDDAQWCKDSS